MARKYKKIYTKNFLMNGSTDDPIELDFRLYGLHKKEYFDENGDLHKLEFYTSYDPEVDVYTGLAVKEDRTYTRDSSSGLLKTRITTITWYDVDGGINTTKDNVAKYYSAKKGFVANKRARRNLIDSASMTLYAQLMANNAGDATLSETQVEDFEDLTNAAQSKYVNSNTNPLIAIVTETTDNAKSNYRDYITVALRDSLLSILDISYV